MCNFHQQHTSIKDSDAEQIPIFDDVNKMKMLSTIIYVCICVLIVFSCCCCCRFIRQLLFLVIVTQILEVIELFINIVFSLGVVLGSTMATQIVYQEESQNSLSELSLLPESKAFWLTNLQTGKHGDSSKITLTL